MSRLCVVLLVVIPTTIVLGAPPVASAQDSVARPPTVVVAALETDRTGWMPPPRFGDTLAELLTAHLTSAGARVIDRTWLTASVPSASAADDGLIDRLLGRGVDYVVLGSVTRLSLERHATSRAGLLPVPIVGGLIRKRTTEAVIGLTVRVVDARTGEIVRTATVEGGGRERNASGGGLALVGKVPLIGGSRSSATGIQDRLLDEAVQQAIGAAAGEIAGVVLASRESRARVSEEAGPRASADPR